MKELFGQRILAVLACLAVLSLLATTDFSPMEENSFKQLGDLDGRVEVLCVIVDARPATDGTLLDLEDSQGMEYKGYCRYGVFDNSTEFPASVRVIGSVERASPGIIFIESIEPIVLNAAGED